MTRSRRLVVVGLVLAAAVVTSGAAFLWPAGDSEPPAQNPSVPAATSDFSVASTPLELPPKCRPQPVKRRLLEMLRLFNAGRGDEFVANFAVTSFHPYPSQIAGIGFQSPEEIVEFVADRHAAGDAWSASRLYPPLGTVHLPREAIYGLEIVVSQGGQRARHAGTGVKISVDCRSGRVLRWLGPRDGPTDMPSIQT